jgi:hypothetical protein
MTDSSFAEASPVAVFKGERACFHQGTVVFLVGLPRDLRQFEVRTLRIELAFI